jgi:hypothetical protein
LNSLVDLLFQYISAFFFCSGGNFMARNRVIRRRHTARRAVAIVLVLGMLAMTLSVAYAMLRMQSMSIAVSANYRGLSDARMAAMTGMNVALRTMHQDSWTGVGTSVSGQLGSGMSFTASYTAGDASLTPAHPDYSDYPYRVTIRCTGSAEHPQQAAPAATHVIETVVTLVPRAIQSTPSAWSRVQGNTVCQWGSDASTMELPSQFTGNVHAQANLTFAGKTPVDDQRAFDGYIDEVAILNKALTPLQILDIHNAATLGLTSTPPELIESYGPLVYWRFNEAAGATTAVPTVGSVSGEYVSAKSGQTLKPFTSAGNSVRFDGVNDSVYCGNLDVSGNKLTILLWFRAQSFNSSGARLIAKALSPSDGDQFWSLGTSAVTGVNRLKFWVRTDGITKSVETLSGDLVPGLWTFAAAVYDGTRIRVYKDGLELGSLAVTGNLGTSSSALVTIGDTPPGSPRGRLMWDYARMQQAALGDSRPVTGNWMSPSGTLSSEARSLFTDELQATVSTIPANYSSPVSFPVSATSYQLYKGGPVYQSTLLSGIQSGVSLLADVKTNPLGIFRSSGGLEISSATINGTLVVTTLSDPITMLSGNITIDAVNLPILEGETVNRQIPIVIAPQDLRFRKELTSAQLRGMVVAGAKFEVDKAGNTPTVSIQGSLVTRQFNIVDRDTWNANKNDWRAYMSDFLKQKNGGIAYFPQWLETFKSMATTPRTAVTSDGSGRLYHWPDFSKPLFEKRAGDEGLRWRIVSWKNGA